MSYLYSLLSGLALAWGGLALFALLFARSMIFPVPPASYDRSFDGLFFLESSEGERIAARMWELPSARFTILFSHGNGEDLGRLAPFAEELRAMGFAVMAYDYPGYGLSSGKPSEASAHRAIQAAWHHLTEIRQLPPERILLHGRSLGGGPTLLLAASETPAGLILESTFVSTFRVLTRLPLLPWDIFDNLAAIKNCRSPIIILHGEEDETVPIWHAQRLARAARAASLPLQTLFVPAAGHNNLRTLAAQSYPQALQDFAKTLPGP